MIEAIRNKKEVSWATHRVIMETVTSEEGKTMMDEAGNVLERERLEPIPRSKEIEASFFTCPSCGLESWTTAPVGAEFPVLCGQCGATNSVKVIS